MRIACLSFTSDGKKLAERIQREWSIRDPKLPRIDCYANQETAGGIRGLLVRAWKRYDAFVFVASTGIAVRMTQPYLEDKTRDPAVVVVDDQGKFSISLVSGHLGGANALAKKIGEVIDALPVITTASDNRGLEAVDLFAKRCGYVIEDMGKAKTVTAAMLENRAIGFYSMQSDVIDYPNLRLLQEIQVPFDTDKIHLAYQRSKWEEPGAMQDENTGFYHEERGLQDLTACIFVSPRTDLVTDRMPTVRLIPKVTCLGIGCRKGVATERMIQLVKDSLDRLHVDTRSIRAIASIDVKRNETAILETAQYFGAELRFYSAEELEEVADRFAGSRFVEKTVGVGSVAEPSAYLLGGELCTERIAKDGITLSVSGICE